MLCRRTAHRTHRPRHHTSGLLSCPTPTPWGLPATTPTKRGGGSPTWLDTSGGLTRAEGGNMAPENHGRLVEMKQRRFPRGVGVSTCGRFGKGGELNLLDLEVSRNPTSGEGGRLSGSWTPLRALFRFLRPQGVDLFLRQLATFFLFCELLADCSPLFSPREGLGAWVVAIAHPWR